MNENNEQAAIDQIIEKQSDILRDLEQLTQANEDDLRLIIDLQKDLADALDRIIDAGRISSGN